MTARNPRYDELMTVTLTKGELMTLGNTLLRYLLYNAAILRTARRELQDLAARLLTLGLLETE